MKKLVALCVLLLLSLSADDVAACVCALDPNPTVVKIREARLVAFEKATVVFAGEVISHDVLTVKFVVDKVWKGEVPDQITMLTGTIDTGDGTYRSSSCDYNFIRSQRYVVYGYGSAGELKTHACSRTVLLEYAKEEIKGLDEITPHKSLGMDQLLSSSDEEGLVKGIDEALKANEGSWQCTSLRLSNGIPAADSPRGVTYYFQCKRGDQSIIASIFFGASKREAIQMLAGSQKYLSINNSKPLEGMGDRAYDYAKHGSAWITFRRSNVFCHINVGLVDARKMDRSSAEMDGFTVEALETARRFGQHVVDQIRNP